MRKSTSTPMECNECGRKFKKKIGINTLEVKCPKCGGYDTEPGFPVFLVRRKASK